jgi:hypothetical protein
MPQVAIEKAGKKEETTRASENQSTIATHHMLVCMCICLVCVQREGQCNSLLQPDLETFSTHEGEKDFQSTEASAELIVMMIPRPKGNRPSFHAVVCVWGRPRWTIETCIASSSESHCIIGQHPVGSRLSRVEMLGRACVEGKLESHVWKEICTGSRLWLEVTILVTRVYLELSNILCASVAACLRGGYI